LGGEGDAEAAAKYAKAFDQDPGVYGFIRCLQAYEKTLGAGTTMVFPSDSNLLRYLQTARSI